MAQIITNQASLNFQYNGQTGTALSNLATAVLQSPLTVEKISLTETYRPGEPLTYTVSIVNGGATALTNVEVIDNLGAFTQGTTPIVPLDYIGPALLFINGESEEIEGTVGDGGVTFTIPTLAAGANALIVYRAEPNDSAPLAEGSEITNTVSVGVVGRDPVTAEETVTVENFADISITKSMTADTSSTGTEITYQFSILNRGNTDATELVLTDAFDPAPESITVEIDGTPVPSGEYTYEDGTLTLPLGTLPAATVTTDPATGIVTVTPSTVMVTVVGTL